MAVCTSSHRLVTDNSTINTFNKLLILYDNTVPLGLIEVIKTHKNMIPTTHMHITHTKTQTDAHTYTHKK